MSRFLKERYASLQVYTPGEQPKDTQYTKLNTNESPYPPAPSVAAAVTAEVNRLQLYCDPECAALRDAIAAQYGVERENVYVANGSDDILNFAFMAFAGGEIPAFFPDISYGFYKVFANLHGVSFQQVPLREDFSIAPSDYDGLEGLIVLANPNAPTGLWLEPEQIESMLRTHSRHVVLIDEAYVDFGAASCANLIHRYDNLLVVQTFSKSRGMAGARLGFAFAAAPLIEDLNRLKYATNPYNVNRMTQAAGVAAIREDAYYMDNCRKIMRTREDTSERLRSLGFEVLPSRANFIFARTPRLPGGEMYAALRARGVLVRHFEAPRISDYIRITIGTPEDMRRLTAAVEDILGG